MNPATPSFVSLALRDQPPPDWADVVIVPLPPDLDGAGVINVAEWTREVFSVGSAPAPVKALMGLRQLLVPLIGVAQGTPDVFRVQEVEGDEALVLAKETHLDFRAAVGIDRENRLLRMTTAVWLHGWRGRVYFAPVSVLHDPISRAMMHRAVRRVARRGTGS